MFGRPVAAVSYRPDDSSGTHDIMFDAKKTRQSSLRRVKTYLRTIHSAQETAGENTAGDGNTTETHSLWDRMSAVAAAVASGTDFLRVDFFLDAATGNFWLNEMDTTWVLIALLILLQKTYICHSVVGWYLLGTPTLQR